MAPVGVGVGVGVGDAQESFLYPSLDPYETGRLDVGDGHILYWEQSGNPNGVPVVFLHGGPGGMAAPAYRRFFDPAVYRIILFDQRGSGRSQPYAEITNNTTGHLVSDLEVLRAHVEVSAWLVFGGSWGSTLALAYGQAHPTRCLGFILRGIFLCRRSEIEWFMWGMGTFFPEAWSDFMAYLPLSERGDPLTAYSERLCHEDPKIHRPASQAWCAYETACSRLLPEEQTPGSASLSMARLEAHYMAHEGFMKDGALLKGMEAIAHLPAEIVQGRYDMVCPIVTADELARRWSGATYTVVNAAGHSAMEPDILGALVSATERFKILLENKKGCMTG